LEDRNVKGKQLIFPDDPYKIASLMNIANVVYKMWLTSGRHRLSSGVEVHIKAKCKLELDIPIGYSNSFSQWLKSVGKGLYWFKIIFVNRAKFSRDQQHGYAVTELISLIVSPYLSGSSYQMIFSSSQSSSELISGFS
jgi:hypothetical protein